MPLPPRLAALTIAASLSLASPAAFAQNLRDVPLGGRTATMGGVGVGAGYDAAMPYLNPAGVAGTPYDVLSVSGNIYSALGASAPQAFLPNGLSPRYADVAVDEQSYKRKHLLAMPSAVAYFKRFAEDGEPNVHVLALAIVAPSYGQEDVTGTFRASGPSHRIGGDVLGQARYRQLLAGPTYALALGDRVRIGASLLGSYSDLVSDEQQISFASDARAGTLGTSNRRTLIDAFSVGLSFVGGVQVRPFDDVWVGAAVETGGLPIYGGGTLKQTTDVSNVDASSGATVAGHTTDAGSFTGTRLARPMRLSAGLAYDRPHVFSLAADVHVVPGGQTFRAWSLDVDTAQLSTSSPYAESRSHVDYRRRTRPTTDISVGAELWLSKTFALRAGVMTDHDVAEVQTAGEDRKNGRVDWTVFTLGLGHALGRLGTTYGLAYRRGTAVTYLDDTFGPGAGAPAEVPYTVHGVMLILAGSVKVGDEDKKKSGSPF